MGIAIVGSSVFIFYLRFRNVWSKVLPGDSSIPANDVQDTDRRSSSCVERSVRGLLRECDEFQVVLVAKGGIRKSLGIYEEGARACKG